MKILIKILNIIILNIAFLICNPIYSQVNSQDKVYTLIDSIPQGVGGLSVDVLGFIYVADFEEKVWQINPFDKSFKVFADGFYGSSGNSFDSYGNLYQANFYGNFINKINRHGEVSFFADSLLKGPVGIAINKKNELFVCNCKGKSIIKINQKGRSEVFSSSDYFHCPNGITIDNKENLYVVSYNNNYVIKITPEGESSLFAKTQDKIGNGHITYANNTLYVTGFHEHKIYEVNMKGKSKILAGTGVRGSKDGSALYSQFSYPNGIGVSPDGKTLYTNDMQGAYTSPNLSPMKSSIRKIQLSKISDIIKEKIESNDLSNLFSYYKKLKNNNQFSVKDTKLEMNTLGHNYMMTGKYKEAELVFKMNIESYPEFALTYIFMGRNMYLSNRNKEAIKYYKKAIELRPQSSVLKLRLKEIEKLNN